MAIEQPINRDFGALGGLTGLKTNKAAMETWFSTSHNIEKPLLQLPQKQCWVLQSTSKVLYIKEATTSRVGKDETAVSETCEAIEERISNHFTVEPEWDSDIPKPPVILRQDYLLQQKFAIGLKAVSQLDHKSSKTSC